MGRRKSVDILYRNDFNDVEDFEDMCFDASTFDVDKE